MYHSICIVLLQHISPLTQLWTQTFIVAYETPIFKSVQSNSCFRNQCWSGVKSAQALKKRLHPIHQSDCNIFGQNLSIFNPNWFKHQSFFDWYVYKPVDLMYKWIGSTLNSKPVVYMGLSQVKICILQTCCFRVTNQNASFRQAKKIHYFLIFCLTIFKHMFVHSAQTQGAMLELKSRKKN